MKKLPILIVFAAALLSACTHPARAQSPTLLGNTTLSANRTLTIPATASLVVASNATITLPDAALQIADTSGLQTALDAKLESSGGTLTLGGGATSGTLTLWNGGDDAPVTLRNNGANQLEFHDGAVGGSIKLLFPPAVSATLSFQNITENTSIYLPNASGTLALTSDLAAYVPTTGLGTGVATALAVTADAPGGFITNNRTALILNNGSTAQTLTASTANLLNPSATFDPSSIYNSSTGEITVTKAGYYIFTVTLIGGVGAAGETISVFVTINGTPDASLFGTVAGDGYFRTGGAQVIQLNAADVVMFYAYAGTASDIDAGGNAGWYILTVTSL